MPSVRVLVVDDSALVRKTVRDLIEQDARFQVVGQAANGAEALERVVELSPDVVTLDLDMPVMDGMAALPRLVQLHRQRVLVLSTHATTNSYPAFKALALGAIDFVSKPGSDTYLHNLDDLGKELRAKLAAVASVSRDRIGRGPSPAARDAETREQAATAAKTPDVVVAVGGSTGGATALEAFLTRLPTSLSVALVVVQHLPQGYSRPFARYLSGTCAHTVKEAEEGESLIAGSVYVAPGGSHLRVQNVGGDYLLRIDAAGPTLHGFRPAIDALFYSVALAARRRGAGVLLSGMGSDGGHGLVAIRSLGGRTLAQDYESCVVPDMPMRAVALGAVERLAPAHEMGAALSVAVNGGRSA